MAPGFICQACGIEAPVKYVAFHQNVGALVVRFRKNVKGNFCKKCVHKNFWKLTGVSLVGGWWGTISFFVNPFLILSNVGYYLKALGMSPVPPGATVPLLTEDAGRKLQPHTEELVRRLNAKEGIVPVATDLAARAGVTPGQVVRYVQWLAQRQAPPAIPKSTGGFPVQPVIPKPVIAIPEHISEIALATENETGLIGTEDDLGITA